MAWLQAIDGLTVTLDYYSIKIERGISNLTPEFVLNECLDGDLVLCEQINRGATGDLWIGSDVEKSGHIVSRQENLAIEKVVGIPDRRLPEPRAWGHVDVRNVLSLIVKWEQQEMAGARETAPASGVRLRIADPRICATRMRVPWTTPWILPRPDVGVILAEGGDRNEMVISRISTIRPVAIWEVKDGIQLRTAINNLFDKAPPIAGNGAGPATRGNGNTFPGLYDALGRYWFFAAGLSF